MIPAATPPQDFLQDLPKNLTEHLWASVPEHLQPKLELTRRYRQTLSSRQMLPLLKPVDLGQHDWTNAEHPQLKLRSTELWALLFNALFLDLPLGLQCGAQSRRFPVDEDAGNLLALHAITGLHRRREEAGEYSAAMLSRIGGHLYARLNDPHTDLSGFDFSQLRHEPLDELTDTVEALPRACTRTHAHWQEELCRTVQALAFGFRPNYQPAMNDAPRRVTGWTWTAERLSALNPRGLMRQVGGSWKSVPGTHSLIAQSVMLQGSGHLLMQMPSPDGPPLTCTSVTRGLCCDVIFSPEAHGHVSVSVVEQESEQLPGEVPSALQVHAEMRALRASLPELTAAIAGEIAATLQRDRAQVQRAFGQLTGTGQPPGRSLMLEPVTPPESRFPLIPPVGEFQTLLSETLQSPQRLKGPAGPEKQD